MRIFVRDLVSRNELLTYFGLSCLGLAIVFVLLAIFSTVKVTGTNAWFKPIKFALSIAIYTLTMAWYSHYLQGRWNQSFFNAVTMATLGFEIIYIAVQAARGQTSHFNLSSPVYAVLYSAMAVAATVATVMAVYAAFIFFVHGDFQLPAYYLWAIRISLVIFIVFSFEGFLMGARLRHSIGGEDGGPGLKLLGWNTKYGDGRVAHFFGMHALQVIPLASHYLFKRLDLTIVFSLLYFSFAGFTLVQALRARPWLAL